MEAGVEKMERNKTETRIKRGERERKKRMTERGRREEECTTRWRLVQRKWKEIEGRQG